MLDIQSIVIYLGLAVLCFVLAKIAEHTDKKIFMWIIALSLALVAGLRAVTVGIDTKTYLSAFEIISGGSLQSVYGLEQTFMYICAFFLMIWDNSNFLLFVFALVPHALIILRLWKDRKNISLPIAVLTYYILCFPFSLNGVRQFVAVGIIFYATSFIKEGKYIKFIILNVVAILFHVSAIVGFAYLIFEIIFAKHFDAKRKMSIYIFLTIGAVIAFTFFLTVLDRYSAYFEREADSVGLMMILKVLLFILSFIFISIPRDREGKYFMFSHRVNYFVGLLLNSLSYMILYAGRIGLYFYIFEAIHLGYIFKSKSHNIWATLFKVGYIGILMLYLYTNITSGGHGELPYRFFWQI